MNMIDDLKAQIKVLEAKIEQIQKECVHPMSARTHVSKGSSGNYDPTADCYWTEHTCNLCQKRWTEGL